MKHLLFLLFNCAFMLGLVSCCGQNQENDAIPVLYLRSGELVKVEYVGTGRYSQAPIGYNEIDIRLNPADSVCSYRVFYKDWRVNPDSIFTDLITVKHAYTFAYSEVGDGCESTLSKELTIEVVSSSFSVASIRRENFNNRYYVEVTP